MTITAPDARSGAPGQAVADAALLVLERMATATAAASPTAATTTCGTASAGTCPGYGRSRSACTGSGTRR